MQIQENLKDIYKMSCGCNNGCYNRGYGYGYGGYGCGGYGGYGGYGGPGWLYLAYLSYDYDARYRRRVVSSKNKRRRR